MIAYVLKEYDFKVMSDTVNGLVFASLGGCVFKFFLKWQLSSSILSARVNDLYTAKCVVYF